MRHASHKSVRGFTLLEMMVSLALGLLVVGTAVKLFSLAVDSTWVITQRAEMQQDLRAASDLMMKDISLAGAGPQLTGGAGIALASATAPVIGCNQAGVCMPTGALNYPCASLVGPCTNTLYPIMPGFTRGITPPGSLQVTDVVTVVYSDPVLALSCYSAAFPAPPGSAKNPITFTSPPVPLPATCVLPTGVAYPQALTDPVVGLVPGDILLFTQGSLQAVAEVSNVIGPNGPPAPGTSYAVAFNNADPLNLNQNGVANDLSALELGAGTTAERIYVISYYLRNLPDPAGIGPGTPTLMRQVNGQVEVPVAENVVNMQFTYDTYNAAGALLNNVGDAGYSLSGGGAFSLIRKINVVHLSTRSELAGAKASLMAKQGYQTFDYQASISARNLSYQNRYVLAP
jgi:prepilin-type N-terminal cleavage/methylation domain-containing protein